MCSVLLSFALYSSASSNLKDPLAIPIQFEWRRSGRHDENVRRCISYSISDSVPGQADYMFRNGYNFWCRSRTLCSHPRCKSSNVLRPTVILTAHDCPFLILHSVLFPFSIACYEGSQRAFCADNCVVSSRGRGRYTSFRSRIYRWNRRYWCKNWCRGCSYRAVRRWDW